MKKKLEADISADIQVTQLVIDFAIQLTNAIASKDQKNYPDNDAVLSIFNQIRPQIQDMHSNELATIATDIINNFNNPNVCAKNLADYMDTMKRDSRLFRTTKVVRAIKKGAKKMKFFST